MYGIRVRIWGDYACFSRPELKVERYSYDCITPSAARGILESVFWHPGMRWIIDSITVQNPIGRTSVRRNELQSKITRSQVLSVMNGKKKDRLFLNRAADIAQRSSSILTDVSYIVEAHFEMTEKAKETDSPAKFISMMKRRLEKGQNYKMPYLGCREFPANIELYEGPNRSCYENSGTKDLGIMLYDIDYETYQPIFFHAVMEDGMIHVNESEVYQ